MGRFEGPATDHSWRAEVPITHGFGITSATAAGPMLNLAEPSGVAVAVGKLKEGPMPQISLGSLGRRKIEALVDVAEAEMGTAEQALFGYLG